MLGTNEGRSTSDAPASLAMLIGRVVLVAGLIPNGLLKLADFSQTAAGMGGIPQVINGRPFPGVDPLFYFPFPEFFLAASITFDILGALLLIVGLRTRPVALLMAGYCLLAMTIYHHDLSDPENLRSLFRSIPLVAGLIFIAGAGAGAWSMDGWLGRRRYARMF